jgi:SAM-dependent methyltransferase
MDVALEERTLRAEDEHWWYRGRRRIVAAAVERALAAAGAPERPRILDAGCGGGAELAQLASLGDATGVEPSGLSRERALARGAADVLDARIGTLPFDDDEFDLVVCLDVIEHIEDDVIALADLLRVVRPGGGLVVTVPAHPRLWSRHDELNHHCRRYTRSSLSAACGVSGWRVRRLTHFNTFLLPLAAIARRFSRGDGLDVPAGPLNTTFEATLRFENRLIRAGLDLPFGLSLLAELRKPG